MTSLVKSLGTIVLLLFLAGGAAAETRLLMFEEDNCPWCARWRKEVGHVYEKTVEGKQAPLVVLDIHAPVPTEFTLKYGAHYSPTFVLVVDGTETGRIEGYPGEDFFWGLLEKMLENRPSKEFES